MIKIWRLFVPTRTDGILAIALLMVIVGFVFHSVASLDRQIGGSLETVMLMLIPLCAVVVAAAACVGWWSFGVWRLAILVITAVLATVLPFVVEHYLERDLLAMSSIGANMFWIGDAESSIDWALWSCAVVTITFLASLVLMLVLKFVPGAIYSFVAKFNKRFGSRFEMSRTRILISTAVFLFVVGMVNNVLLANGFNLFRDETFLFSEVGSACLSAGFGLVGFLGLVFWPSWSLLRNDKIWIQCLGVTTVVAALAGIFALRSFNNANPWPWIVDLACFCFVGIAFFGSVWCLKNRDGQSSYPSLWSLFSIGLTASVFASPQFVDYSQLVRPRWSNPASFSERLRFAVESGFLNWQTGGQVKGADGVYEFNFGPDTDPDVLKHLDLSELSSCNLFFSNLNPGIDTSLLQSTNIGSITLINAEVTGQQLKEMTSSAGSIYLKDVRLVGGTGRIRLSSRGNVILYDESPGAFGRLFSGIEQWTTTSPIYVHSRISNEDWPELLRVGQSTKFVCYQGLEAPFEAHLDADSKLSARNITMNLNGPNERGKLDPTHLEFVLNTDVNLMAQSFYYYPGLFWDLAFENPNRIDVNDFQQAYNDVYYASSKTGESQFWEDHHWVFGKNSDGKITDLFLPNGYEMEPLPDAAYIKRLSYDVLWLIDGDRVPITTMVVETLRFLEELINLEELYFSECQINAPLNFLSKLTKLRHLQIPINQDLKNTLKLSQCPELESITLLGTPNNQTVIEIGKLAKLKKLLISDVLNELSGAEAASRFKKRLAKMLPEVEIEIVPFGEHVPSIPREFSQHLSTIREKIRNKLLKE